MALWEIFSGGAKVKISKMAPQNFQIGAPPPERSLICTNLRMTKMREGLFIASKFRIYRSCMKWRPHHGWGRLEKNLKMDRQDNPNL